MPKGKIDLGGYVEVKDRIKLFYERFPDGRLVTQDVTVTDGPDNKPRVWVKAAAYRDPDDKLPAIGWSWMELPGKTPYTAGSELENTETSAWGRAIGALGIGIETGIASAQEVQNKRQEPSDSELHELFDEPVPNDKPVIIADGPDCPNGHGPMSVSRYGGWWCRHGYGTADACGEKAR